MYTTFEIDKLLLVPFASIAAAWLMGHRLSYRWNIRQKRRESLLAPTNQLHAAYGEFFIVWKLWNRTELVGEERAKRQWELLQRAAKAEATVESILLMIVTGMRVSDEDLEYLGKFREAFQSLRLSIRTDKQLGWNSAGHPHYLAFKQLSCRVALLLQRDKKPWLPGAGESTRNYVTVTSDCWKEKWWEPNSAAGRSPSQMTQARHRIATLLRRNRKSVSSVYP